MDTAVYKIANKQQLGKKNIWNGKQIGKWKAGFYLQMT